MKRVTGEGFKTKKGRSFIAKNMVLLLLRIFAISSLIFGIAGMNISYSTNVVKGSFVIALDTSSSMLADDFSPNRLEAAKDAITVFLGEVDADISVGIVSFAGLAYTEMDLSDDKKALMDKVSNIGVKRSGGTDITQALMNSINLLEGQEGYKSVILITDGRNTVGSPVDLAADYAKQKHVVIDTIGMATVAGGSFLNLESISTLDESTLKKVANQTGGNYFNAESPQALATKLMGTIKKERGKRNVDITWYIMSLGLTLIMIEWVLANTKYRSIP